MKISDINNFENNRNLEKDWNIIRFYKEGNWWRAYEWSGYLCYMFPNDLKEEKKLKAIKNHYKELNVDLVAVGLRLESFGKYFPSLVIDYNKIEFKDGYFDVDVNEIFDNDFLRNNFNKFKEWKNSIKIKERDKTKSDKIINESKIETNAITKILYDILDYQLANKTLIEDAVFISIIQEKIRKTII